MGMFCQRVEGCDSMSLLFPFCGDMYHYKVGGCNTGPETLNVGL